MLRCQLQQPGCFGLRQRYINIRSRFLPQEAPTGPPRLPSSCVPRADFGTACFLGLPEPSITGLMPLSGELRSEYLVDVRAISHPNPNGLSPVSTAYMLIFSKDSAPPLRATPLAFELQIQGPI
jgi:hypothetical protein